MTLTITVQDVRDALAIYGITTDLTDAQIEKLIEFKIAELSDQIGVPIGPVSKEYDIFDFNGSKVFLQYYPVQSITSFKIDNVDITEYKLKKDNGYIKLSEGKTGDLVIVYEYGLDITPPIKYLIIDMIVLRLKYGIDGQATSVREGDVQVSYGAYSFSEYVQNRIDNLRNKYAGRLRLL